MANGNVSLFPDYTFLVQQQRALFLVVKKEMREQGIRYALMFPVWLKVMMDANSKFFTDPKETWDWLELY